MIIKLLSSWLECGCVGLGSRRHVEAPLPRQLSQPCVSSQPAVLHHAGPGQAPRLWEYCLHEGVALRHEAPSGDLLEMSETLLTFKINAWRCLLRVRASWKVTLEPCLNRLSQMRSSVGWRFTNRQTNLCNTTRVHSTLCLSLPDHHHQQLGLCQLQKDLLACPGLSM